ncbi:MAG: hypothetical protein WCQ60_02095 [bacterium]
MATALLTGAVVAFSILAIGKWTSSSFFYSNRVPLYDANTPVVISASLGTSTVGPNVDEESAYPLTSPTTSSPQKPVPISAPSYLVVVLNASTSFPEKILLEKNSFRAVSIASLTKLATAVVAQNILDQNAAITITSKILSTYPNDPAGFRRGEQFKTAQLLYPLLMVSSNDAAEALAQSYAPGRAWFIKAMNDWAYSIGAYNTFFADPSGLSPENISSPHDLAIILAWVATHRPDLLTITQTKVKYAGTHTWTSPTQLLNLTSYLGGKNGYLPEAGQTSVSLFHQNNHAYIVVVLGSKYRDQDILNLLQQI